MEFGYKSKTGLNKKLRKYLFGIDPKDVTDEQALDAFLKFMADEDKGSRMQKVIL